MYLIENPHLIVKYLVYLILVCFFILMVAGSAEVKRSSFVLFLFALVQLFIFKEITQEYGSDEYLREYVNELSLCISLSGLTSLSLTMFIRLDKAASKQALILVFATIVHTMVLCDLTIRSSWFSLFFFNCYDELIIIVGILQIWMSRDGMAEGLNNAFRRIQGMLFRFVFHYYRIVKSLSERKKIKGRA